MLDSALHGDAMVKDNIDTRGRKTSCSLQKILDSLSYVFVPRPMSLFPTPCLCSPWGGWIPRTACISLKTAPNNMKLVSIEREKLALQDYVIKN